MIRPRAACRPALLLRIASLLVVWFSSGSAWAWLETRVVSDVATIQVAPDGRATVRHELLLRVRGGPLRRWSLHEVDPDAVPLPGASLVLAKSGQAAGVPIALVVEREQTRLDFELVVTKGVGSGTYLVQFEYDTDLAARGLVHPSEHSVRLRWQGPRFEDGIGSLKARFVLPRAEPPPALSTPLGRPAPGNVDLVATDTGVFLTELVREPTTDVLELTRPHAAKGEQVTWMIDVARSAMTVAEQAGPAPQRLEPSRVPTRAPDDRFALFTWLSGLGLGVFFALLIACKQRWLATRRGDQERAAGFLVPLPAWLRYPLLGSAVAVAFGLAFDLGWPTHAALLLVLVLLLATQHAVPDKAIARGPGQWHAVDPEQTFFDTKQLSGWGSLLEGTTLPGFFVVTLALSGLSVVALRGIADAPYRSAALVALSTLLVPVFFTLGGARLCLPRLELERAALAPIHRLLQRHGLMPEPIGRRTARTLGAGGELLDEVRIRIPVAEPLCGFDSLELAFEAHHGGWFLSLQPVFIVRVRDGSLAHLALPRDAQWSRGRLRDERIALLRPRSTTASACSSLAKDLCQRLRQTYVAKPSSKRQRRSSGKPELATNATAFSPPS